MKRHPISANLYRRFLLTGLMVCLVACQSGGIVGKQVVEPENRIPLQDGGPHDGTIETFEMIFRYSYQTDDSKAPQAMHIRGGITRFKFPSEYVRIHLDFLNNEGLIVDRKLIYSASFKQRWVRNTQFDTQVPIPSEAVAIAFATRAQPRESKR